MDVHVPVAESSKDAGPITPCRVVSPISSSSVEKIIIMTPKRDFCIYCEESEIVRPVQESGEPGSAELVNNKFCESIKSKFTGFEFFAIAINNSTDYALDVYLLNVIGSEKSLMEQTHNVQYG